MPLPSFVGARYQGVTNLGNGMLLSPSVHVDQPRRDDVAPAVDGTHLPGQAGRRDVGADLANIALLDQHAASGLGAGSGIDEAGVDEGEQVGLLRDTAHSALEQLG